MSTGETVTTVVLVVVLLLAIVLLLALRRARRRGLPWVASLPGADGLAPRAAVVVHGVKVEEADVRRRQIESLSERLGWREPLWLETTAEETGRAQAIEALDHSPAAVLAFGGDGTARMVADGLSGSGVPMGLLPAGTGNLLARNLGIPPNRLDSALQIALTGGDRPIDVCWATYAPDAPEPGPDEPVPAPPDRQAFLVMAGLGFDAEIMAGTDSALKEKFGWGAYVVAGARRLRGRRTPVSISVDDGPPVRRRVRAVVVGNCGTLQAGIRLMPDAAPDDGWLDVVVLSPRSVLGWFDVVGGVMTRRGRRTIEHLRCHTIEVKAERPMLAQLDGDPHGESQFLRVTLDHKSLIVRVPTRS
ncbi:diacylglycerol/lipid kinase family protein [Spongisporangium articulatum]|uniref:Diacylglycerol/lipid kinase family protein n=1 Tax=Spongisporangium articulatum TaxID=3362603 RepID=A0ABW8AIB3_9ACTN